MLSEIRPCLSIFVLLTLITGVLYPAVVTGIAQVIFPHQANGSLIVLEAEGKQTPVGSSLIGQTFDDPRFFWGRPSAVGYNASSSSGSNLGPINPAHLDAVKQRVEALQTAHPDQSGKVPVDLVTASASGLDPHISPAAAEYQVSRVAKARGLTDDKVRELVAAHTAGRTFGVLGEPRVNVLTLNLALESL